MEPITLILKIFLVVIFNQNSLVFMSIYAANVKVTFKIISRYFFFI